MAKSGVVYNHLPQTIERLHKARSQIIRKTVLDVERGAKQLAPVKTGLLKASIYSMTADMSTYRGVPLRLRKGGAYLFPTAQTPEEGRGLVLVGVSYGIFVEFGTIHMAARPFLTPAAMAVLPDYIKAWMKLEAML